MVWGKGMGMEGRNGVFLGTGSRRSGMIRERMMKTSERCVRVCGGGVIVAFNLKGVSLLEVKFASPNRPRFR